MRSDRECQSCKHLHLLLKTLLSFAKASIKSMSTIILNVVLPSSRLTCSCQQLQCGWWISCYVDGWILTDGCTYPYWTIKKEDVHGLWAYDFSVMQIQTPPPLGPFATFGCFAELSVCTLHSSKVFCVAHWPLYVFEIVCVLVQQLLNVSLCY